jgi:hypothetical protein
MTPLLDPQIAGLTIAERTGGVVVLVSMKVSCEGQLKISVTVTVYIPAPIFWRSSVVDPLFHKKEYDPNGDIVISIEPFGLIHELLGCIKAVMVKIEPWLFTVKV